MVTGRAMKDDEEMRSFDPTSERSDRRNRHGYRFLNPRQIEMIDAALGEVGAYGEVRLVVEKSRLRFIVTQVSHDALLWQPKDAQEQT
jgi:hypothetical protein